MLALKFFTGAPRWVWPILGYLLFLGICARQERTISLLPMILFTLVFLAMDVWWLFSSHLTTVAAYLAFLFGGTLLGFYMISSPVSVVHWQSHMVTVPGENFTLIFFMSYFCIKFVFGVFDCQILGLVQAPFYRTCLMIGQALIKGLFVGINLGRLGRYVHVLYRG